MASSLFQQMTQNSLQNNMQMNPQIQSIMQMVKESGMSPKELFYKKAKEMGIDPDMILNQLR